VPVHEVRGDFVGNALIAQGCDEVIEQDCCIPGADGFPQIFAVWTETCIVDEGGSTSDMADLKDQPGGMGECRIFPWPRTARVGKLDFSVSHSCSNHRHELALGVGIAVDVTLGSLDRAVTGQQLDIAQRTTRSVDQPRGPRDERSPTRMR
jgi:hypothetical protein